MNMMSMKMMAIFAGMGIVGYMYMKKHPEMIKKMKIMGKEEARKMYNLLDEE